MTDGDRREGDYPEHLAEAAQAIDELRAQRHRQLRPSERTVQRFMYTIAQPRFVAILAGGIVVWVVLNAVLRPLHAAFDDPAFNMLNLVATLMSLVLVIAILSGQHTQATLEQERARLLLQLMLIQDRKISELLKQLHPHDAPAALHEETDIHAAARALEEAENTPEL